jgi:hypothetical protein
VEHCAAAVNVVPAEERRAQEERRVPSLDSLLPAPATASAAAPTTRVRLDMLIYTSVPV